ncbi:MAG: hypothetical protein V1672_02220 [Candidatus Diapherotrites archaeon]
MRPGKKGKTQKRVQLGLFGEDEIRETKRAGKKRLSHETLACRELALKLTKRGLICATLMDRITGKRINLIKIIGAEIETLARTSGFDEKKFVKELVKAHVQNPENMRKFVSECWPYKKNNEEIKKVQNAINVIAMLILKSADARSGQRRFTNISGTQLDKVFTRKISKD